MALMICNMQRIFWGAKKPDKTYFAFLWHRQALDFFGLSSNHADPKKQDTKSHICSKDTSASGWGRGEAAGQNDPKAYTMTAFKQIFSKCSFIGKTFGVSQNNMIRYRSRTGRPEVPYYVKIIIQSLYIRITIASWNTKMLKKTEGPLPHSAHGTYNAEVVEQVFKILFCTGCSDETPSDFSFANRPPQLLLCKT